MIIRLFGFTTPTGVLLSKKIKKDLDEIYCYSRSGEFEFIDLNSNKNNFFLKGIKKEEIWINLAPIWLFAKFLKSIKKEIIQSKKQIKGIITCSSSSIITKKYSWHWYDKNLVVNLKNSENFIINYCEEINIKLRIIRPTMIYGCVDKYNDKNFSKIKKVCQLLPFIFFPKESGLRQPISIKQLSEIIYSEIKKIQSKKPDEFLKTITVGGDQIINYYELVKLIIKKNNLKCKVIKIPNKYFIFFISPILLFNSRLFSEFLRINSNLSGFIKSSEILLSEEELIYKDL